MHVCLKNKPDGYKACRKCRFPKGGQPPKIIKINVDGVDYDIGTNHKLYNLRYAIISRCYNAKLSEFNAYQGKGIKVCDEWLNNPAMFYTWAIKSGWQPGLTIDRMNPDKDYCPENCQFLSRIDNTIKARNDKPRFGDLAANSKLNSDQVKTIKYMLADGLSNMEISKVFNVDRTTISCIKLNKTWSNLNLKE